MAMKKCKECGTEISSSAKVCPHCGKKQKTSKKVIGLVVVLLLVIIVAASGGDSTNNNTVQTNAGDSKQTQNTQEPIEYTAVDIDTMEEALKNNAAAAKDTYNGKYFEIIGRLGTIDSDLKYISLLSTTDDWDLTGIHCSIKNDEQKEIVKTLSKNDTIVVKGKITNVGEVMGYTLDITEISK